MPRDALCRRIDLLRIDNVRDKRDEASRGLPFQTLAVFRPAHPGNHPVSFSIQAERAGSSDAR